MKLSQEQRESPSAFTLVELLTVIAIIGILAGIMIPVVGRIRYTARITQCASNLRQIYLAFELYATDNKETWPAAYSNVAPFPPYPSALRPYIPTINNNIYGAKTEVYMCPEAKRIWNYQDAQLYGVNASLYDGAPSKPAPKSRVTTPSRTILLGDMRWDGSYPNSQIGHYILPATAANETEPADKKHARGAANLIFADGHVQFFKNTWALADLKYRDKGADDVWSVAK